MPPQDANPTPSFGGFGLNSDPYLPRIEVRDDDGNGLSAKVRTFENVLLKIIEQCHNHGQDNLRQIVERTRT